MGKERDYLASFLTVRALNLFLTAGITKRYVVLGALVIAVELLPPLWEALEVLISSIFRAYYYYSNIISNLLKR